MPDKPDDKKQIPLELTEQDDEAREALPHDDEAREALPHDDEAREALPHDDEAREALPDTDLDELPITPKPAKHENVPLADFEEALSLEGQIEALIFASPKPITPSDLLGLLQNPDSEQDLTLSAVNETLKSLESMYRERSGGFILENLKSHGYQFRTVKSAAPLMERLFASRPRPLSRAALETMAILAYKQPVTRADIEYIRGVDSGSILKNLMERDLVACVGRKEDSGRPMMFGTTVEFLKVFGLDSLDDLPPLESFQPSVDVLAESKNPPSELEDVDVGELLSLDEEASDEDRALLESALLDHKGPLPEGDKTLQGGRLDHEELGLEEEITDGNADRTDQAPEMDVSDGDSIEEGS